MVNGGTPRRLDSIVSPKPTLMSISSATYDRDFDRRAFFRVFLNENNRSAGRRVMDKPNLC